ncbi:hypothetical protein B484DRAFT_454801 [Ochromonadaceae sp. CCMP2298]|nr:hypothetical protein B484DRAFT_454801 [Ochromonadaceae sp. CCMP2298]
MLRALLLLSGIFLFAALAEGWQISRPMLGDARRLGAAIAACTLTTFSPVLTPAPALANPIEAASRAMSETRVKEEAAERPFDKLPEGAKKREALKLCKDSEKRSSAGYKNAESCGAAVMSGNYAIAFPSISFKNTNIMQPPSSSSAASSSSISASPSASVSAAVSAAPQQQKREKTQDLSDLPAASKKRRALAGCKKAEVRKYAGQGSESKCTGSVIGGDYEGVIEALEYGL